MKHPHCNRSHAAHLFWCRGFAPVFFIVAVALIVVAVGSGLYFTVQKSPVENVALPVMDAVIDTIATSTDIIATTSVEVSSTVPIAQTNTKPIVTTPAPEIKKEVPVPTAPKIVPSKPVDCGEGATAETCMFDHIASCTAAKAIFSDEGTGVRVEHTVDGLVGGECPYRSTIIAAPEQYAILEGLNVQCNLPKDQLLKVMQASNETELLQLCTGSYIDILRQARGMTAPTE